MNKLRLVVFRRKCVRAGAAPNGNQEVMRRVEGLLTLADQNESRFHKARLQVDKRTPSLLARAFRGHLVPQDPTDEPAEKLLERIHAHPESKSKRDAWK